MKKTHKRLIVVLAGLLLIVTIASSAVALCEYTSSQTVTYNRRICTWACGFTGLFYKQDVWDEKTTYYCANGTNEYYFRYDVRNGNCC